MSLDEGNILNMEEPEESPPPEEKGNRTFLVIGGILAGLIFLTLVGAALYFLVIRPKSQAAQISQEATLSAQRLEQSQALTATAAAALADVSSMSTPMPTQTSQPVATDTPVVVVATQAAPPTSDPATLVALQTQLAAQLTHTAAPPLATSAAGGTGPLPTTGFFDEVGLPLMILLTFALLGVILVARRLRKNTR